MGSSPTSEMTNKLVPFYVFFLIFAAFSMKRKRTANAQVREPKARRASPHSTPLLGKKTWNIVHSFLLRQTEQKLNKIQKHFSQFPTKYENISDDIKRRLYVVNNPKHSMYAKVNCRFFKHFETEKMYAENVTNKNEFGWTVLHYATQRSEVTIAKAVIEAGVNIDATTNVGLTALHWTAIRNDLQIGRALVEADADLNIKYEYWQNKTALAMAVACNHNEFAEMLRKKMENS